MAVPSSKEWRLLFHQARDVATQLEQELTSAHVLLSLFLLPNKAEQLLLERDINEDVILAGINPFSSEPPNTLALITQKSQQIAMSADSQLIDSLHLLIAMSRVTSSLAYQLLEQCETSLPMLRNQAMAYLTGRVRRRFDSTYDAPPSSSYPEGGHVTEIYHREHSHPDEHTQRRETPSFSAHPSFSSSSHLPSSSTHVAHRPLETKPDVQISRPGQLDEERFPWLSKLGRNLTLEAREGQIDPLVGREKELNEMIDVLGMRRANNPCLVGPPGVGKTALVEGLAVLLARTDIPGLSGKMIIELDMGGLLAGTHLRGSFSEKLKGIKEEVKSAEGQIIIFIDEIHTLVRAGSTGENAQDAANDLKTVLGRGHFPCIGATTHHDFKMYIEPDLALVRRFQLVSIEEPSTEEAIRIVSGVIPQYASHHRVQYLADSISASVRLGERFLHDRRLPAKAFDILDLAGSRARRSGRTIVGREQIAQVVAQLASVPEEYLLVEDKERVLNMESILNTRVIGHSHLMSNIAAVIRRNYAGFNGPRPSGSFLFLGPPGVGKTETAKAIASFLFHNEHAMLRIDMSEYHDSSSVTRLIGAPPGFVGHEEGGQLTEAIRAKPYQLILLDEIEKAHRDVLMLLLQLLDEGVLTDGKGRHVSFSQCVIVMTSNLGSECCEAYSRSPIGFSSSVSSANQLEEQILESARGSLPIEFWNRIDERLVFTPLQTEEIRKIARLMINSSSKRLQEERDIAYVVSQEVIDWVILHGGFHPRWGARPMRAIIQRQLEASLAELILRGEVTSGDRLEAVLTPEKTIEWNVQADDIPAIDSAPPHTDTAPVQPTAPRRVRRVPSTPPVGLQSRTSRTSKDGSSKFDVLALPVFDS